jgi:hypothetical protein
MIVAIFRPRTAADPSLSFVCHEDLTLTVNGKGRVMDTVGKEKSRFLLRGCWVDPPLLFFTFVMIFPATPTAEITFRRRIRK